MLFLQFYIDQDRYVIDTRHIISVVPLLKMHKADGFQKHVFHYLSGFINYIGQTIPVVDLTKLISGRMSKPYLSTRIILANYELDGMRHELVGFIAEKATEVVKLADEDFCPNGINNESAPYLGSIAKDSKGLLQHLDIKELIEFQILDYLSAGKKPE